MNFLDKVFYNYDQQQWRPDPKAIYGAHLESLLSKLAIILGDLYYEFRFVFYDHNLHAPLPDFKIKGDDVILIFVADERSTVPLELCDQFFAIFKNFYPYGENVENFISFPMGYSNSAPLTEFIPFDQRRYSASYAGNFLANRLDFYRQFNWLKYLPPFPIESMPIRKAYFKLLTKSGLFRPRSYEGNFGNSYCYWSGGFAKGLPREKYAEIISGTRIALCPKGFITTECFRLMETMRLGCVIIADELPPSRWYKDSPILVVKDWLHIRQVVEDLQKDPDLLMDIHQKTLAWWNDVCSDDAVAAYLADEVRRLKYGR